MFIQFLDSANFLIVYFSDVFPEVEQDSTYHSKTVIDAITF